MNYSELLKDLGPMGEFKPYIENICGNNYAVYLKNVSYYAKYINTHITEYRDIETDEIVGMEINIDREKQDGSKF